jgi:hypothetical protein
MIRLFRYYTYLLSKVTTCTTLFLKLFNFVQRDLLTLKIVKYSTAFFNNRKRYSYLFRVVKNINELGTFLMVVYYTY